MKKNYLYTTQKEINKEFWNSYPDCDSKKITSYDGKYKMYKTDTRVAFCDFVDSLSRNGLISAEMVAKVTLK